MQLDKCSARAWSNKIRGLSHTDLRGAMVLGEYITLIRPAVTPSSNVTNGVTKRPAFVEELSSHELARLSG